MTIRVHNSAASDGKQAVQMTAEANVEDVPEAETSGQLTAAETAGLNGLTSASAATAMLGQQAEKAAVPTTPTTPTTQSSPPSTTFQAASMPGADPSVGSSFSTGTTGVVSDSFDGFNNAGAQRNPASTLSVNEQNALNALVQNVTQRASTPVVTSDAIGADVGDGDTAQSGVAPGNARSATKRRNTGKATAQPSIFGTGAQKTSADTAAAGSTANQRKSGNASETLPRINTKGSVDSGFKPVEAVTRNATPVKLVYPSSDTSEVDDGGASAGAGDVGRNLSTSLASKPTANSSALPTSSESPDFETSQTPQQLRSQPNSLEADNSSNIALLRELGLLPQETPTLSSNVAFYESLPEDQHTTGRHANNEALAERDSHLVESRIFGVAKDATGKDVVIEQTDLAKPHNKSSEIQNTNNLLAEIRATAFSASDFPEISGSLSDQEAANEPVRQRLTAQSEANAVSDNHSNSESQLLKKVDQAVTDELADRQKAYLAAHRDALSTVATIDSTQAAVDTAASEAAMLKGKTAFTASADTEALDRKQSGNNTDSQDEQSSNRTSVNSSMGGADGAMPILSSYMPPLFNRRLEKNGVDDALILLIASMADNTIGRTGRRKVLKPVAAVPVVADREQSPEERASDTVFPEQIRIQRRWLRTPQLSRPYFHFDSDAFERAYRDRLLKRPEMQRRRPRNPIMSDPRSTSVAERAAFWVHADMDGAGLQKSTRLTSISATMSHRALHPLWMQPLANGSINNSRSI